VTDPLERPTTLTVPTHEGWSEAMRLASCELLNSALSDDALSVCWAQWALETGRGKHCWNWNLGNIKRLSGRPWMWLDTWEMLDDGNGGKKKVFMKDRFTAFDSLEDGALEYLRFLLRPYYRRAWAAFCSGDAAASAHELKVLGYYTDDEGKYTRGLVSLAAEFKRTIAGEICPDTEPQWSPMTVQPVSCPSVDETLAMIFAQKPYNDPA
jgi:hypothetical protein